MTNLEALNLAMETAAKMLAHLHSERPDEEAKSEMAKALFFLSTIPQLEGFGELIGKAWVEQRPTSEIARKLVMNHLVDIGKAREGVLIFEGSSPVMVGEYSPEERARHTANEDRSAQQLGLKPRDV
jgi:hypothetical protein